MQKSPAPSAQSLSPAKETYFSLAPKTKLPILQAELVGVGVGAIVAVGVGVGAIGLGSFGDTPPSSDSLLDPSSPVDPTKS